MKTNQNSLERLDDFNVIELNQDELTKVDGGWAFIGTAAVLAVGGAALLAFSAGVVVGIVAYKVYEHYSE